MDPRSGPFDVVLVGRLGNKVGKVLFFAELQRAGRTRVHAVGQRPRIHKMRAPRALLWKAQVVVPVDGAIGTGVHQFRMPRRLRGVDDDQAVLAAVHGVGRGVHAGRVAAMAAQLGPVLHPHLRNLPMGLLEHLEPELPGVRLRLRIRRPLVSHRFVLARQLARVAAVAFSQVDDESFHSHSS